MTNQVTKWCARCRVVKPVEEFFYLSSGKTTLNRARVYCVSCYHERRERSHRRRYYGISDELYQEMLKEQGGRCLICRSKRKLDIDHDHKTGIVRGLLCRSCNLGLGYFKDNPILLARTIKYLLR